MARRPTNVFGTHGFPGMVRSAKLGTDLEITLCDFKIELRWPQCANLVGCRVQVGQCQLPFRFAESAFKDVQPVIAFELHGHLAEFAQEL